MKRIVFALALATAAATSFAATQYLNNAGESEENNVVKIQLGDAGNDQYRNEAGQADQHQPQVADASDYRNDAGQEDKHQPQLG